MEIVLDRKMLKAGDHIYSWRKNRILLIYTYAHHGIYIGDNKVVHFVNEKMKSQSCGNLRGTDSSVICGQRTRDPECGHRAPEGGMSCGCVTLSCLDCFLEEGELHRYDYGVSQEEFKGRKKGTCTTTQSDPPEEVLRRIKLLLQTNEFGDYHLLENNCEYFAVFCKTGLRPEQRDSGCFPLQVHDLLRISSASCTRTKMIVSGNKLESNPKYQNL